MWKILLEEFIGDLRTQKLRVFLTSVAVAWGTAAVVLLLAFGEGLRRAVTEGLLNAGERMYMIYGGETTIATEGLPIGRRIRLTEDDLELIRRGVPDADLLGASYGRWGVSLRAGDQRTTTYMEGVTPAFGDMRRMYAARGGRFLNEQDLALKRRVIFLGDSLALRLFGVADPVGETVAIDGLPFTVVGVLEPKMQTSMNNGPDALRAIIPASTMKTIYGQVYVGHLLVRPRDVSRSDATKRQIYEVLGRRHKFDPDDRRALAIWDFVEEERLNRAIGLGIQIFLGVVGIFTLLVAGVGVANIMYVVVRERTREIGVKLAIGARRHHIVRQFMFEAVLLAFGGGLVGLAISVGIVRGVDAIPDNGDMIMMFLANPKLSWPIALCTVGTLALIGLVAGIFPARRAAALDPVESLRYE
ncbi:MAG TPA: ABC transporter permease [Longimicrobiales bacterium]|nr:ABC transporter permease [Longimicrobiales bacterium]